MKRNIFIRASEKIGVIIGVDNINPNNSIYIVSFSDIPMSHDVETSPYRYFENELEDAK